MRARQARLHALFLGCLLSTASAPADDRAPAQTAPKKAAVQAPASPEAPRIAPATPAEVARERLATEARLRVLSAPEAKDKPSTRPIRELLEDRRRMLQDWEKVARERSQAERPEDSPERLAAETKVDLEKTGALLEQSAKAPDALLPEAFQAPTAGSKPSEARLAEMKEAIDGARVELKDRSTELEKLRAEGTRTHAAAVAGLRLERDKVHQGYAGLIALRGEREAAVAAATSAEARDLAADRLVNFDWQARVEAERLASLEARIGLAARRVDLATIQVQARAAHAQLARRVVERMEERYAALAERQRVDLKRAVVKEESLAARSDDPLVKYQAKRTAELLQLQEQVVAFEKANATASGLSVEEQKGLADATVTDFEGLKKLLNDGVVSPLDALRLKNDFRRIGPERAQIVRTDLAASVAELTTYENALNDAEIDLVNDARDDRFDREALLDQVPQRRRGEATAMLDELEARHRALLNRRKNVLVKLAQRAEAAHSYVLRRIDTLDQQYAFIRAHIFWIRDAEPLGGATFAHARDDSLRAARALVRLACEAGDRPLWGRVSPEFVLGLAGLVLLPWPLRLGQKALDRARLGNAPDSALGLADFQPRSPEA